MKIGWITLTFFAKLCFVTKANPEELQKRLAPFLDNRIILDYEKFTDSIELEMYLGN